MPKKKITRTFVEKSGFGYENYEKIKKANADHKKSEAENKKTEAKKKKKSEK